MGLIQRTQCIRLGEAFERGAAEPASVPQIARIPVSGAARHHEALGIGFGQALDLTQAETQRLSLVIPAKAKIHGVASLCIGMLSHHRDAIRSSLPAAEWIPAFAGMTIVAWMVGALFNRFEG